MKKAKERIYKLLFFSPRLTGWIAFAFSLALALFFTFAGYQLRLASERELVTFKLNEFENLLTDALNDGVSAAKTLGFIAQYQRGVEEDFQNIGQQLLSSNPHVDVLQLLDSGRIVAVYPLSGNETVIGYDVLKDPKTKKEVEEAILRNEVYFSGPLQLKQGGNAIVGRYPLFKDQKFAGISAVIIYFNDLLRTASLDRQQESPFWVQLSKVNPNSGLLENFLPEEHSERFNGFKAEVFLGIGNWTLSLQLKKSTAIPRLILHGFMSLIGSALFGFLMWNFARQPSLLMKKLKEKTEEILLANERFELASQATSDAIWDWNLLTNEKYRSSQFSVIFGYGQDELERQKQFRVDLIHPEDQDYVQSKLQEALSGSSNRWEIEFRGRKADQSYAYVREKGFIIRDSEGKAVRMIGATQDITKQKTDKLNLIQANQQLSNANEELKIFASLASHDLREPLRMISSFMSLLEKNYGPDLDDKAKRYISYAMDGAKRLTVMINDLLEYSKVGFESSATEFIDTRELVEKVIQLKSNLIRESEAEIRVGELPVIKGVKTPLQLVFQNLIGNALKYRNPDVKPEIVISGKDLEHFWEFSVEDNGIGIDGDYLEHIFGILKRLHPKEKYPGTGMGLATCRKIVSQHGGKIWAESTIGLGSKFLFTIKKT
ncbi:PAS domain-containing protein [Algoriphagus aestuariicola]|uniref:histidine kinase n=1 Tax=Algoriphagus aestuariicola TaxID=1852016 RepID=A0ABS3BQ44_9BACT|nr:ATP-binding protein [Algoriphagus aestuariicola]MBN7801278.1 PAS domain-containing protein [Algoriphagus aestuariicola]